MIHADGTGLRRLTNAAGSDANAGFSRKGDLIAFESNRVGTPEIYVMKADGSDVPERLTNFTAEPTPSNANVTKPTWSPMEIGSRSTAVSATGCARSPRGLHDER